MFGAATRQQRWRWRAAGFIFVSVVIVAGCQLFPRGDRRFVGQWNMASRMADSDYLNPWGTMEFRSNGTAVMAFPATGGPTIPFPWQADATTLTFGEKPYQGPEWMHELSDHIRFFQSGSACFGLDEATYEVLVCTPDQIEIAIPGDGCRFVLTRIAE